MVFGRNLSNLSLNSRLAAVFPHSRRPDFDIVKHVISYSIFIPNDAIAEFQKTVPLPTVIDLTKLLSAVVKMKQYSVALHLFEEMLQRSAVCGGFFKRGYEPIVVTFTNPIKALLSVGRIDDAAKLLKELWMRNCVNLMKLCFRSII